MKTPVSRFRIAGAAAFLAVAVAACGGSSTTSSTPAGPTPVDGGTINLGVYQEPTSFLDAGIVDSLTFSFLEDAPVMEGLLWYKSTDETANAKTIADYFAPSLATEVPTTQNGDVKTSGCTVAAAKMCVTWKLRHSVMWHDGTTFSSHDVCDTFKFFYLKYGANNPTALLTTSGWDQVMDCNESDPNTAVVSFKSVFGPYLELGTGAYGILPSKFVDAAFAANGGKGIDLENKDLQVPVDLTKGSGNPQAFNGTSSKGLDNVMDGTGPYVFQSYTPNNEMVLVKNNNYWGKNANPAHTPHLDKVVFKFVSGIPAELTALQTGSIDAGFDYRLFNLKPLLAQQDSGKVTVQTIPDSGAEKIDLNLCANAHGLCGPKAKANKFLADPKVRRALLMGINRDSIVQNLAAGKTVVPQDSWMYLGVEYISDPTLPKTKYDQQGAMNLLDQAGYKTGNTKCDGGATRADAQGNCLALDLGTTNNNDSRLAAETAIHDDLAKIGVKVNTPFTPNLKPGAFFGAYADNGPVYTHNYDMVMYTNTVSSPGQPDSYYPGYHADCGGTCPDANQIPSDANKGNGQNDTGEDNPTVDKALDQARQTVNLADAAKLYRQAEQQLAQDLPELPLYQQVTVDAFNNRIQNVNRNDVVWDYNIYDWFCTAGKCQS